jgi:hypothetical protein
MAVDRVWVWLARNHRCNCCVGVCYNRDWANAGGDGENRRRKAEADIQEKANGQGHHGACDPSTDTCHT